MRLADIQPWGVGRSSSGLRPRPRRFRIRLSLPGDARAHRRHRGRSSRRPASQDLPHQSGGNYGAFPWSGPDPLSAAGRHRRTMADLLRWTLADPDIPAEAKDPPTGPRRCAGNGAPTAVWRLRRIIVSCWWRTCLAAATPSTNSPPTSWWCGATTSTRTSAKRSSRPSACLPMTTSTSTHSR